MTPEEFLRAALAAGAHVQYVDGVVHATVTNNATVAPPEVVVAQGKRDKAKPFPERTAGKNYKRYRDVYGTTNASVVAASVGLLIGHRYGNWKAEPADILVEAPKIDIPTMQMCARAAVLLEHSVNRGRIPRVSMATSAVAASMYAAIDVEPALETQDVIDLLQGEAFKRVLLELDRKKVELGGPRSDHFRKESLNRFLAVMLGKEV